MRFTWNTLNGQLLKITDISLKSEKIPLPSAFPFILPNSICKEIASVNHIYPIVVYYSLSQITPSMFTSPKSLFHLKFKSLTAYTLTGYTFWIY